MSCSKVAQCSSPYPPSPRHGKRNKRAPMGACFHSSRLSLFSYSFSFPFHCLLIFSLEFFFLRTSHSRALQGAGFMSWCVFGVLGAGQYPESFYIAYTAIHEHSASSARRTPHDASSCLIDLIVDHHQCPPTTILLHPADHFLFRHISSIKSR